MRKITILKDRKPHVPWAILNTQIKNLLDSAKYLKSEKIQTDLKKILPTYTPRDFVNPDIGEEAG